ncbi:MAG: flagellar filament capping protein FliD [Sedimentisphaerales bacterium]|nr:flagellar filament capping protein FliD [Sedimentisphaerales bacterium]
MGTISSGTGLISGLDIESLITQLMAIEQRPRDLLSDRIESLTTQQTALMGLQARIMALQVSAASFNKESIFRQKSVVSSDESVLTATADRYASTGSHRFLVKRLATQHNMVSRGYASLNSSLGTGTVSLELGAGQLSRATELSFLNGQAGIQRGTLTITDRGGQTAQIDLTSALTMQDVLDAINGNAAVQVTATVSGDRLVITDQSGGTGTLTISGQTAESLGIAGSASAADPNRIVGGDILYLSEDTLLRMLNDQNGVRGLDFGDDLVFQRDGGDLFSVDLRDKLYEIVGAPAQSNTLASLNHGNGVRTGTFRITDRNGAAVEIDLSELTDQYGPRTTVAHLRDFIQEKVQEKNDQLLQADPNATLMNLTVSFSGSDHLIITDNSQPLGTEAVGERLSHLIVEDLNGGHAAADLGIAGDLDGATLHGSQVWYMESVGDVINAVNHHWANWDDSLAGSDKRILTAALDAAGNGLMLTQNGTGVITVAQTEAADDLGLANTHGFTGSYTGRRLISGLNTVMLRSIKGGSAGLDRIEIGGAIELTDRAGNTAALNLLQAFSVQDVLEAINQSGTNITASINAAGNGIQLTDQTAAADVIGNLSVGGDLAEALNLSVSAADGLSGVNSDNLQLQYVSQASLLSDLRAGQGIRRSQIRVTDGDGVTRTINLARDEIRTLQDVIDAFASSGTNLRARINDTGDGLLVYDELSTGALGITIEDVNGNAAADLRIAGSAAAGSRQIDGSYEARFALGGGDTIQDLVSRINDAGIGVQASLVNDGSASNPYRISLISEFTGRSSTIYLDAGRTNLTTQTLTAAQDALVLFGDDPESAFLVASSTNTLDDTVEGVTIELHAASASAVQLDVDADLEGIVAQITNFVSSYNAVMKEIEDLDSFDPDTLERSVLFADRSIDRVRYVFNGIVSRTVPGMPSSFNRLASVGISLVPLSFESQLNENNERRNYAVARAPQLEFDEAAFREAYAEDPERVIELFTKESVGVGEYLAEQLETLAGTDGSSLQSRLDAMEDQKAGFEDRIERLDDMLARKEERLYSQFYAMEQALASLQTQQTALSQLSSLTAATKT